MVIVQPKKELKWHVECARGKSAPADANDMFNLAARFARSKSASLFKLEGVEGSEVLSEMQESFKV
jgi:hypothetical protein